MPADSLIDTVRARASAEPDRAIYRVLETPDASAVAFTAAEVDRGARAVAASLAARHEVGDRVLLLLPPGRAFVLGFLGSTFAGLVPVPAPAPSRTRIKQSLPALLRVADDCHPTAVLTTGAIASVIPAALEPDGVLARLPWHPIEELVRGDPDGWSEPHVSHDDAAFLQYTSGSTTDPRGVVVRHSNLAANLRTIQRAFDTATDDHAVVWLPPYHDMGLVGGLLTPLDGGFDVTLMAPQDFVQSPVRWLRAISDAGGTISGGPDFAYRLCVERVRDEQLDGLDLRTWRLAFTGAEPISAATLRAFAARFASVGFDPAAFYPCYGLAESTLIASGGDVSAGPCVRAFSRRSLDESARAAEADAPDDARELVGNGSAVGEGTQLLIVDPAEQAECPPGSVGEIWLRGPSVAAGYFGRERLSSETFAATLADGRGPFLRTGDLGFVEDGELFVTGRIKDIIIVTGRTLDAHDIEAAVQSAISARRQGLTAALSITEGGHERFVVLQEVGRLDDSDAAATVQQIQGAIASRFDVRPDDVALVAIGDLPRTTSGKLRRAEAASRYAKGELRRLTPSNIA